MKVLYFDCFSGISGDMILGALLHLGLDQQQFKDALDELKLDGEFTIEIREDRRKGISGLKVDVTTSHHHHGSDHLHHRHLDDIQRIIESSELSPFVKKRSISIFKRIAEAEGKIHGKSPREVHFHEVGAVDSIVDIVGACICMEMLDVDRVVSSPLNVGGGFVECAHGTFPVPAPATLEILKGVPVYSSGPEGELVTPTGAAIIKEFAGQFAYLPPVEVEATGYGLGTEDRRMPNVLRVVLGEDAKKKMKLG